MLTNVIIPSTVKTIESYAFFDCPSLVSFDVDTNNQNFMSDSLGVLYNKNQTQLIQYPIKNTRTSYTIPNGVKSISDFAFYKSQNLQSVVISESVEQIGRSSFESCTSLSTINIPNNVVSISYSAFRHCPLLTIINLPGSVNEIDSYAFNDCDSLSSIVVDSNNQKYKNDSNGILFSNDHKTIIQYPNGNTETSYTIPKGVQKIKSFAFYKCTKLTSITIPSSVESIGMSSFEMTSNLRSVTYEGINQPICEDDVFKNSGVSNVYVNDNYEGNDFCGVSISVIPKE